MPRNIAETSKVIDSISGLESAANNHIEWIKNFHRIIVCDPQAHTKCNFGRWYDMQNAALFPDEELFLQIGQAHQTFHQLATEILEIA
ncbi:MAG: hypothetical protein FD149_755 [Rhodospirillaceae bacterium]|nr:MAG: hypothetical protein FD149_755 [Rhodospirillaceae bacterium]